MTRRGRSGDDPANHHLCRGGGSGLRRRHGCAHTELRAQAKVLGDEVGCEPRPGAQATAPSMTPGRPGLAASPAQPHGARSASVSPSAVKGPLAPASPHLKDSASNQPAGWTHTGFPAPDLLSALREKQREKTQEQAVTGAQPSLPVVRTLAITAPGAPLLLLWEMSCRQPHAWVKTPPPVGTAARRGMGGMGAAVWTARKKAQL